MVSRANRRLLIRIVRLCRSTCEVFPFRMSGCRRIAVFSMPLQIAGLLAPLLVDALRTTVGLDDLGEVGGRAERFVHRFHV